jgi:glutamate synthase domain-containing protein 1
MANMPPKSRGLYDPRWEHDACGIGAIVNISGRREHSIVEQANQILLNLQHRGAAGADGVTGDGAGMLMQIPHEFLAAESAGLGIDLPKRREYGVAMVF